MHTTLGRLFWGRKKRKIERAIPETADRKTYRSLEQLVERIDLQILYELQIRYGRPNSKKLRDQVILGYTILIYDIHTDQRLFLNSDSGNSS
jgi:hypothetical protein